ncbi:hypothetical protein GCM10011571_15030 [Marinithermofilum abyssi]|uniref:Uncharacterized protein n=1 Tax=Marinithermofilum abyssi TaxID=1571185 RepID=A0A8J2VHI8_9BACL|nr:hypothetical protein [Marinithermofilum abyssi]GGE14578.1 hypothetical protein GCM10011571_15030 [Marinithermofilum abyssi]
MSDHRQDWEAALDSIEWDEVLEEVGEQLKTNLAAELRFRTYEELERASQFLGAGYYLTHLSDGTWAFWNEKNYVEEDVQRFQDPKAFIQYVIEQFQFNREQVESLIESMREARQMKRCIQCGFDFDPQDPVREELGIDGIYAEEGASEEFCSPQCAIENVVQEMKES